MRLSTLAAPLAALFVIGAPLHLDARDKGKGKRRAGDARAGGRIVHRQRRGRALVVAGGARDRPADQDHGGRRRRRRAGGDRSQRRRARARDGPSRWAALEHDGGLHPDRRGQPPADLEAGREGDRVSESPGGGEAGGARDVGNVGGTERLGVASHVGSPLRELLLGLDRDAVRCADRPVAGLPSAAPGAARSGAQLPLRPPRPARGRPEEQGGDQGDARLRRPAVFPARVLRVEARAAVRLPRLRSRQRIAPAALHDVLQQRRRAERARTRWRR